MAQKGPESFRLLATTQKSNQPHSQGGQGASPNHSTENHIDLEKHKREGHKILLLAMLARLATPRSVGAQLLMLLFQPNEGTLSLCISAYAVSVDVLTHAVDLHKTASR